MSNTEIAKANVAIQEIDELRLLLLEKRAALTSLVPTHYHERISLEESIKKFDHALESLDTVCKRLENLE